MQKLSFKALKTIQQLNRKLKSRRRHPLEPEPLPLQLVQALAPLTELAQVLVQSLPQPQSLLLQPLVPLQQQPE
jgi:hypothetical protein